jgi:hypothetical protein
MESVGFDGKLDQIPRAVIEPLKYRENIFNDDSNIEREYKKEGRILKQTRSEVLTNSFISKESKESEIKELEIAANEIVGDLYNKRNRGLKDMTIEEIMTNMSDACVGISRDIYKKPDNVGWVDYSSIIILKNGRYKYIGMMIIFIVLYIYIAS